MQQFKRNPLNVHEDQIKNEELERFPQRIIEDKRAIAYLGMTCLLFHYIWLVIFQKDSGEGRKKCDRGDKTARNAEHQE